MNMAETPTSVITRRNVDTIKAVESANASAPITDAVAIRIVRKTRQN